MIDVTVECMFKFQAIQVHYGPIDCTGPHWGHRAQVERGLAFLKPRHSESQWYL